MQWFKHDADANADAKLQNVLLDYGLEGYGLYWYCIEMIAGKVCVENLNFELEHDARIIARNTGSTPQKVEEMMKYFVKVGLFECSEGVITCLKMAKRLDKSMTSNPKMRDMISKLRDVNHHDSGMTIPDSVMQDKIRLDKETDIKDSSGNGGAITEKGEKKKYSFNAEDMTAAEYIADKVDALAGSPGKHNLQSWANTIRLMRERDGRNHREICDLFKWANRDSFWKDNVLSPDTLRKQWQKLTIRRNSERNGTTAARPALDFNNTDWADKLGE